MHAEALARLLEGKRLAHLLAPLEIVECRDRAHGVAERPVARHVGDALASDIDGAAVAQALEMILARSQHVASFSALASQLRPRAKLPKSVSEINPPCLKFHHRADGRRERDRPLSICRKFD